MQGFGRRLATLAGEPQCLSGFLVRVFLLRVQFLPVVSLSRRYDESSKPANDPNAGHAPVGENWKV
jgi:hypothetical protein